MKRRLYTALGLVAALWVFPSQLQAQDEGGRWSVAPRIGVIVFDGSSALDDAGVLGIDALYYFGNSGFAAGISVDVSRPETKGDFFTPIRLDFGPESELHFVGVRTTLFQYNADAQYRIGGLERRWAPFVAAGLGGYAIYTDNQQQNGFSRINGFAANFGGGFEVNLGQAGFRFEARDFVYFSWDRERLNVVDEAARDDRFPEQHGNPPDPKDTIHNWRLALSFVFVPR